MSTSADTPDISAPTERILAYRTVRSVALETRASRDSLSVSCREVCKEVQGKEVPSLCCYITVTDFVICHCRRVRVVCTVLDRGAVGVAVGLFNKKRKALHE